MHANPVGILNWAKKWIFLLRDRKRHIETATKLVGDELAHNAACVAHREGGHAIQTLRDELLFDAWDRYAQEVMGARGKDPNLLDEVRDVYSQLRVTKLRGAPPPSSTSVAALAERLREFRYGR